MQCVIPLKENRKFNDAWAAILFVAFLLIVDTTALITFLTEKGTKEGASVGKSRQGIEVTFSELLISAVSNILLLITEIAITFASLVYIPRACIYIALFLAGVLPLLLSLFVGPAGLIGGFISFGVVLLVYYFLIRPHIDYIVALVHACAVILSQYIFKAMTIFTLINIVLIAQIVAAFSAFSRYEETPFLLFAFLLVIYWTIANLSYFFQVFVSGIIYGHINKHQHAGHSVIRKSLVYSAYAFGSICFGGLLVAIVQTLRSFVSRQEERNNRRREEQNTGSIISLICILIVKFILDLLETIISQINKMVFSYIALHGTNYKESVNLAFHEITAHNFRGVAALSAIDYVLGLFTVVAIFSIVIVNVVIVFYSQAHSYIIAALFGTISAVLYLGLMSMISSGVLALVYTRIEFSKAVDSYDSELGNTIDVKNSEQVVELVE